MSRAESVVPPTQSEPSAARDRSAARDVRLASASGLKTERMIGRHGAPPGPKLICIGGLHGNEPAGVLAMTRVLEALRLLDPPFRGEMVAIAGNLGALRAGRRFTQRDLNRGWTRRGIERALADASARDESREQSELVSVLRAELEGDPSEIRVIDLHTTSADSIPFVTLADTLRNRHFARGLCLPLVLGIEEQIDGALLEVIMERGPVTLGVEAGQHVDPSSVDHHERAVWMALIAGGHVAAADVPEAGRMRAALRRARRGLPSVFEVKYRKPVAPGDGFTMQAGLRNFQPVSAGEIVARDRAGAIAVPEDGRIFLPLYQDQGDDGFFIVGDVHAFWLQISGLLRRLGLDRVVRWLPGIHPARRRPDALIVDRRVARWLTVQVFHLLGYRKSRVTRGWFVFRRRSHDRRRPAAQRESG